MKIDAVCFDMDGTLIRNTNSVRYLCMLAGKLKEFDEIECREDDGSVTWIEADFLKAELIKGLNLAEIETNFKNHIQLIRNLDKVIHYLKDEQIKSVLITAGPFQVASVLGTKYGFDTVYGSEYEVANNKFTGTILNHLGNDGKLNCLKGYCAENGINLDNCIAVGDSGSDVALFENCGKSIAINHSDSLKGKASHYIITDNLSDIIDILKSWLAG